jgi:hypothetical protein
MKIKIILALILLLIIVPSCINVQVDDEDEIINEPEEIVEEPEEEEEIVEAIIIITDEEEEETLPENQYNLVYGEILTAQEMNLAIIDMTSNTKLTFSLDGVEKKIQDTKVKEIFGDYYFKMIEYNYKGENSESYVLFEITPLTLADNEYILENDKTVTMLGKEITFEEARSDKYIKVTVCDEGTVFCESYVNIAKGEEAVLRGITIGNVEPFYTLEQYGIVSIY